MTYTYRKITKGEVTTFEIGELDNPRSTQMWCDRRVCEGFWGNEELCKKFVDTLNNESQYFKGQQVNIGEIIKIIRQFWTFDNNQIHTHTWHDREDCIREIEELMLKEQQRPVGGIPECKDCKHDVLHGILICFECEDRDRFEPINPVVKEQHPDQQEKINIQNEVQKIHHQYGTSEKSNYAIQLLFEKYCHNQQGWVSDEVIEELIGEMFLKELGINGKPFYLEQRIVGAKFMRDKLCSPNNE